MRTHVEIVKCDLCERVVEDTDKAIKSVRPNMDLHGIWMGDLNEYVWMDDDVLFCSFECFVKWLEKMRDKIAKEKD